jgi:sulfate adenylyltransferase
VSEPSVRSLLAGSGRAAELRREAAGWPSHVLDPAALTDVELLLTGALAPLDHYLGAREVAGVSRDRQLPDGEPFPVPVMLTVPEAVSARLAPDRAGAAGSGTAEPGVAEPRLALFDPEGVLLAAVTVTGVGADDSRCPRRRHGRRRGAADASRLPRSAVAAAGQPALGARWPDARGQRCGGPPLD